MRVLMSHYRTKLKHKNVPDILMPLVNAMAKASPLKKHQASSSCPLPAFRDDDGGGDDEEEEGKADEEPEAKLGMTYFDGCLLKALKLYEDGSLEEPLWYEKGKEGFVIARFEGGEIFNTEMPNVHFKEGKFVVVPPVAPHGVKRDVKRRPAAATHDDDDGDPAHSGLEESEGKKPKRSSPRFRR